MKRKWWREPTGTRDQQGLQIEFNINILESEGTKWSRNFFVHAILFGADESLRTLKWN